MDCVDTLYIADHLNNRVRKVVSEKMAGLPESGTVVSWSNVRSRLRMGVLRESTADGAEIHQALASPRAHQRWRLIASGQDDGEVLYRIENLRSGKVLEVVGGGTVDGAVVAQRAYGGSDADHQLWRLIPVGSGTDTPRVYEIANRNSGLLLRVDTNAPTVIKQYGAQGDHRGLSSGSCCPRERTSGQGRCRSWPLVRGNLLGVGRLLGGGFGCLGGLFGLGRCRGVGGLEVVPLRRPQVLVLLQVAVLLHRLAGLVHSLRPRPWRPIRGPGRRRPG